MGTNTAISAKETDPTQTIIFISREHEDFFYGFLSRCRNTDVYHQALAYCIGISPDTRRNTDVIYDFRNGYINTECLRQGWITSGSARILRLAFNLYCNNTPSVDDYEDAEERELECRRYGVEEIFCCSYAKFFWQAVKLRYPEYGGG